MSLQNFIKRVIKGMEDILKDGYQIEPQEIQKNNGVLVHAVTIRRQGENMAPCIPMDNFYKEYQAGNIGIADVVGEILYLYQKNSGGYTLDVDFFLEYLKARAHLQGRLVNTEKNQGLLEEMPHRNFLDLSLTYLLEVPVPGKSTGYIQVFPEHLEHWGVDEQCLYEEVMRQITEPGQVLLKSMNEIVGQITGSDMQDSPNPAYILTNSNYQNGAVQMLNQSVLESAASILKGDFILLPSSVHELILLPINQEEDRKAQARQLADIVLEVNDTQLREEELLSYHVYQYCRETGEIVIAM